MGTLYYQTRGGYEIEDRTLVHIQLLVAAKLRRQESFMLSWLFGPEHGSGRIAMWISPQVPVTVRFSGSQPAAINRAWLDHLIEQSYTATGVDVTSEAEFDAIQATATDSDV